MTPERSAVALLGILQRHGLTMEVLECWVAHCEAQRTGFFGCHTVHGQIQLYEATHKARVAEAQKRCLTTL